MSAPTIDITASSGVGARLVPPSQAALVETAVAVIFPCLVFGTAMVQQPSTVLSVAGQILLWLAILAAAEIIITLHSGTTFAVLLSFLVAFKAAQVVAGGSAAVIIGYELVNALIFAFAGAAVLAFRRDVLERQLRRFFTWSIPVMILQLYGKPDWIQALRTDSHSKGGDVREQILPSLFESNSAGFNTIQSRPAGLLHANNFLSIVILFALAVHFRRSKGRSIDASDVVLMAVLVLSMAKIAFLSFIVFSVVYLMRGPGDTRVRVGKLLGLLGLFLLLFYIFFPGIFLYDLSPNNAILNYAIRVADLRAVLSGVSVVDVVQIKGIDGSQLAVIGLEAGTQSGYSAAARFAPFLLVVLPIIGAVYYLRYRMLPRNGGTLRDLSVNSLLVLFLSPLITSFAGNPFFSFALAGLALPWVAAKSLEVRERFEPPIAPSLVTG